MTADTSTQSTAVHPISLDGRVFVVTGGASGIGRAIATMLAAADARPVLLDLDAAALETVSRELGGALAIRADITVQEDVDRAVAEVLATHGRIDGLVNNAGISLHEPVASVGLDDFRHALEINTVGALRMLQAVVPAMREAGFGRIVNVSSGTTRIALVGGGPYAATKSALNMLSAVSRAELAGDGIAVSEVLPSITASNFGGGRYKAGEESLPGLVTHTPEYPARAILRAIVTGEPTFDVPHGPEDPDYLAA